VVLLDLCLKSEPAELINDTRKTLKQWSELLLKFALDDSEDQIELIYEIQEYCEKNEKMEKAFQWILHSLYDNDVLTEESILGWSEEQEKANSTDNRFFQQCKKFLKWLKEAEEEDEDDDEDDADDDDDDDDDE